MTQTERYTKFIELSQKHSLKVSQDEKGTWIIKTPKTLDNEVLEEIKACFEGMGYLTLEKVKRGVKI